MEFNRRFVGGFVITAATLGCAGAVGASGLLFDDGVGEAAPPPVTALARDNSTGLLYFQDSEGSVATAEGVFDVARNVAATCAFQVPESPSLGQYDITAEQLKELSAFVASVACDASGLTASLTSDGIAYFVAVPSSSRIAEVRADSEALRIENLTIEVDAAG